MPLDHRTTPSTTGGAPAPTPRRSTGLDAARGLAVLTMFVAHFAPSGGPGGVLIMSEFLAAPLFVAVLAMGAHLSFRRHRWLHSAVGMIPRAAVLWAVGLALETLGAQIDVVLGALAVTALCLPLLLPLPSWALLAVGAAGALVAPVLDERLRPAMYRSMLEGHHHLADLLGVLGPGPHYRLGPFLAYAALGVLVARHLRGTRARIGVAGAGLALAGVLVVLALVGRVDFHPYDGSVWATLTSGGVAVALLLLCLLAGERLPAAAGPLATVGRSALTVYALQIVAAAAWVRALGEPTDNSWLLLASCVVGAWLVAALWQRLLPGRGPLELALEKLVGATRQLVPARP